MSNRSERNKKLYDEILKKKTGKESYVLNEKVKETKKLFSDIDHNYFETNPLKAEKKERKLERKTIVKLSICFISLILIVVIILL